MTFEHLAQRPGSWEMFIKGTRKRAWTVVHHLEMAGLTIEEAADDHYVSVAAVREAVEWCRANRELILRKEREAIKRAATR